jgi:hypothetical protein
MKKEITDLADTSRGIRYTIVVILIILLGGLIGGSKVFGQEKISLNVSVDGRLTLLGDNIGNEPLTLNTLVRFELQGNQQSYGFMFIAPEYEYADLSSGEYHRYSANVGYTFNRYAIDRLEVGVSMGFGFIVRDSRTFLSMGFQVDLGYRLTDRLRTMITVQLIDRTDIKNPPLRGSLFGGLKYYLN